MTNSDKIQNHPGYKRLRKLMDDPRYWKDQDPTYVEMIRQGFRDLYDTPIEAGEAANEAGVNGPVHAQDTEIGHLTKGEVIIPLSAQTPEVMQALSQVLGQDMAKYIVGSGYEQVNPTSGLPAYADEGNWDEDLTEWHFEGRDAKNVFLPENVNDARQRGSKWEEYPPHQNKAHDNHKGRSERKFVNSDGREAVYDGDTGKLVRDPNLRGTYNYANAWNDNKPLKGAGDYVEYGARWLGHAGADFVPWVLGGNDRNVDDEPDVKKHLKRYFK